MRRHHTVERVKGHQRRSKLAVSTTTALALSLRTAAVSTGVTQEKISADCGYSLRTIQRWFGGEAPIDLGALGNLPELLHHTVVCFHEWTHKRLKRGARRNA